MLVNFGYFLTIKPSKKTMNYNSGMSLLWFHLCLKQLYSGFPYALSFVYLEVVNCGQIKRCIAPSSSSTPPCAMWSWTPCTQIAKVSTSWSSNGNSTKLFVVIAPLCHYPSNYACSLFIQVHACYMPHHVNP